MRFDPLPPERSGLRLRFGVVAKSVPPLVADKSGLSDMKLKCLDFVLLVRAAMLLDVVVMRVEALRR